MKRDLVKGSTALAKRLGVNRWTVWNWKKDGVLRNAIMAEYRRTVIYDFDRVLECLRNRSTLERRMFNSRCKAELKGRGAV